MPLEVFNLVGNGWREAWDSLQETHRDVYASPGYYRAFASLEPDARPECAVLHDGRGIILHPYFRRPLSSILWLGAPEGVFDLMTAYGYGGIYGSIDDEGLLDDFVSQFDDHCRYTGVVAEIIRLNPLLRSDSAISRHYGIQTGNRQVVVDLQRSDEEIWKSYRHNNRKNVNKALRSGVEIVSEGPDGPHFRDFLAIYGDTMERRSAAEDFRFVESFYELLRTGLPGGCHLFYSIVRGEAVSAEMVLSSKKAIYSFLGGTREEFFDLRPNNLLKHEIIRWARDRGFERYLLGGGPSGEDGIFDYKKSFAPDGIVDFHIASRIYDDAAYSEFVSRCAGHPPTAVPGAERYVLRWRFGG